MRKLGRLYSEMIFVQGYVHCDPHPGNLLVRPSATGTEIVLLDHGLYQVHCYVFLLQLYRCVDWGFSGIKEQHCHSCKEFFWKLEKYFVYEFYKKLELEENTFGGSEQKISWNFSQMQNNNCIEILCVSCTL